LLVAFRILGKRTWIIIFNVSALWCQRYFGAVLNHHLKIWQCFSKSIALAIVMMTLTISCLVLLLFLLNRIPSPYFLWVSLCINYSKQNTCESGLLFKLDTAADATEWTRSKETYMKPIMVKPRRDLNVILTRCDVTNMTWNESKPDVSASQHLKTLCITVSVNHLYGEILWMRKMQWLAYVCFLFCMWTQSIDTVEWSLSSKVIVQR